MFLKLSGKRFGPLKNVELSGSDTVQIIISIQDQIGNFVNLVVRVRKSDQPVGIAF